MFLGKLPCAFLVGIVLAGPALAATNSERAKSLVDKAIAHVKSVGTEQAYRDFNTPGSPFFDGELYIFAYDMQGNNLALGGNPEISGKNLIELKSADGKFLIKDLIEIIKTKGEGRYDYKWSHPGSKRIEDKTAFIKKIPGTDAFLGCRYYKR